MIAATAITTKITTKILIEKEQRMPTTVGPVWAGTRVQLGDWYGSGTLHPGQVLRGSLPLLSPENLTYWSEIIFEKFSYFLLPKQPLDDKR